MIIEQCLFRWINFVILQTFPYIWQHCPYTSLTLILYPLYSCTDHGITEYGMDSTMGNNRLTQISEIIESIFSVRNNRLI